MKQSVRVVTATATLNGSEDVVVFNSATAINFNLGPAYGDGRQISFKNIGVGAVTLLPVTGETIYAIAEEVSKILYTGESASIVDCEAEKWIFESYEFEITPLTEGGTGIEVSGVNHIFYVDGSRIDTYTADGSILRPYTTILAAQNAINALSVNLLDSAAHFELCKFILKIAPGKYTDNVAISSARYIRWDMEGVEVSGNVTITQNQQGLTDYYGKVEFVGGAGNRAYRGNCALFSGTITFLKDGYDSLAYDAFVGCNITGNLQYGTSAADTHGTWVLCLINSYFQTSGGFISAYLTGATEHVMLESYGYNKIVAHIAKQDGSATKITLYDCNNTYFDLVNTTPLENCTVKNCTFNSTTSIVAAKTLSIDANSYKSLMAQTPTMTGITYSHLDNIGVNPSPCGARTAGAIVATATVNDNIDALDASIGFEAQMSGTPKTVTKTGTVFQMLDQLDTAKSVQTVKKTISWSGGSGTFKFPSANNATPANIDLGAIIPASARVLDVFLKCRVASVFSGGATTLVAGLGNASAGTQFVASATIYAINVLLQPAVGAGFTLVAINAAATNLWLTNITPGANWNTQTAGDYDVYITYIDITNI
jgi:hypothetical protein